MKSVALLVLLLGSACTKRNPAACCTSDEDCAEAGLPPGSTCQEGLTCVFGGCVLATCTNDGDCPAEVPRCETTAGTCVECLDNSECGDQVCDSSSQCAACVADEECGDSLFCQEGSCRASIVPNYLPTICDEAATTDVQLASFNTTTDGTKCTAIIAQAGGPELCVIHSRTLLVDAAASVSYSGERAVVLIADGDLTVDGTLSVSARTTTRGSVSGPGGGLTVTGAPPSNTVGGGGAGFGSEGGAGGAASAGGGGPGGGIEEISLNPIFKGGSKAGGQFGGGGGGGLMLISCHGTIRVAGLVTASGGGGTGGSSNGQTVIVGGSGGGSGGLVVLQGLNIEISGQTFANGGGGGGGAILTAVAGGPVAGGTGEGGTTSVDTPALGGGNTQGQGATGLGGAGAVVLQPAGVGQATVPIVNNMGTGVGPSGGGGGLGAVHIRLPSGRAPNVEGGSLSPAPQLFELATK